MNKRIVFLTSNIMALMFTKPSIERYLSGFDVPDELIAEYEGVAKKTLTQDLMFELFDSGKDYDKKILHDIVEDLSVDPNISQFNYYHENKEEYERLLKKLKDSLVKIGYDSEDGKLIRKSKLIDNIDDKYQYIILNLNDFNRTDLANKFRDSIKNYSTDIPSSLNDMRTVIENLVKHVLALNHIPITRSTKENMKKLKDIGVLKEPNTRYKDTENDFSYNLFQMLSNWGTHHARTPIIEHEYVFQTSILYLEFLIKRINESGVNTR